MKNSIGVPTPRMVSAPRHLILILVFGAHANV